MNTTAKLLRHSWKPLTRMTAVRQYTEAFRQYLANNYPPTQYSKLLSGLTVATESQMDMPMACVGIYLDAGSRYESNFENGVAHFFEHLAFKSTRIRSKTDLEAALASSGSVFRSFTTREMVCYYVQCQVKYLEMATEVLLDCVFNNELNPCEIEHQKKIVYAEMLELDKDSNALLFDYLHASAFQGTPLGNTVMGPSSNLYNFEQKTICGYLYKCFAPTRAVMAAAGGVTHQQILDIACCYLSGIEPTKCIDIDASRYTGSEVRYRDDSMPLINVVMAVEGPSFCDDDNLVMEIAKHMVSGWDRSQLAGDLTAGRLRQLASGGKLCDSFKAFNINYKDTGLWGIQFIGDTHYADDICTYIQEEWMYLCTAVTEAEVERAKNFYITKFLSKLQTRAETCHHIGRWTLYNGIRPTILETLEALERIHAKDVREVCSKFIYNKCLAVAAIGKTEGLRSYERLRANMYWLRL